MFLRCPRPVEELSRVRTKGCRHASTITQLNLPFRQLQGQGLQPEQHLTHCQRSLASTVGRCLARFGNDSAPTLNVLIQCQDRSHIRMSRHENDTNISEGFARSVPTILKLCYPRPGVHAMLYQLEVISACGLTTFDAFPNRRAKIRGQTRRGTRSTELL